MREAAAELKLRAGAEAARRRQAALARLERAERRRREALQASLAAIQAKRGDRGDGHKRLRQLARAFVDTGIPFT